MEGGQPMHIAPACAGYREGSRTLWKEDGQKLVTHKTIHYGLELSTIILKKT
jgi:hypothetical protein